MQVLGLQVAAHQGLDVLEGDAREEGDVLELREQVGRGGLQVGLVARGRGGGEGGGERGYVVEGLWKGVS